MRDLLLVGVFGTLLSLTFKHPWIGPLLWAWLSMMNPHKLTFGFAYSVPFAYLTALVCVITYLFTKQKYKYPWNSVTRVHMAFLCWMGVTSLFAMNTPAIVMDKVIFVAKIQFMVMLTLMLLRGRKQIDLLIWVFTFSIGYYGLKGGVWTVLGGGSGRVWGPPTSMVEGNNELGLALVALVPFVYYLRETARNLWLKRGLLLSMVLMTFSILGSQSRGALLGLLAMGFTLGLKGKHPVRTSLAIVVLIGGAIVFMPDSWTKRMDTISSYQGDNSALSRLYTWKTLWNVALDRPLVGAGFATDNPVLYKMYAPTAPMGTYQGGDIYVAHSIYFQALGEHGFPGLLLYLLIGITTWRLASRLAKDTTGDPEYETWVPMLMRMVQVSLIGFAAGGAFLTLVHFDLPYYFIAVVVLVDATVREERAKRPKTTPVTQGGP